MLLLFFMGFFMTDIDNVKNIVFGLTYPSESDYPFEVLEIQKDSAIYTSNEALLRNFYLPLDCKIEEVSLKDFFMALIEDGDEDSLKYSQLYNIFTCLGGKVLRVINPNDSAKVNIFIFGKDFILRTYSIET